MISNKNPFTNREKIIENEFAFAIYDAYPVSPGHSLIVPKKEVNSFFLLNSEEYNECFNLLRDVRDLLINKFQVNDFNIGINDGCNAGQTINQCHLHIIPRCQGDIDTPRGGIRGVIPSKKNYP